MSTRTAPLPIDAMEDLARRALAQWDGPFADLQLIKFRENAVFSARRPDGLRVALRIHREAYHSDAALRSELVWMEALEASGIGVPCVVRTRGGTRFATVAAGGAGERQIDMLTWLEGVPLGTTGEALDPSLDVGRVFARLGQLAARLHNHAASWQPPAGFVRPAWDAAGLLGGDPLWGRFWELEQLTTAQRERLQQARARARADLAGLGQSRRLYGLLHADLIPENILRLGTELRLIDFDDSGYGWYLFDLATILFVHLDDPAYPAIATALIEGYRSARAISEADLHRLPLFMFLRATTYLGWVQTRFETDAAREMTPMLVERADALARAYLAHA